MNKIFREIEKKYLKKNKKYLAEQLRWRDNEVDVYDSIEITEYYKNNLYGRKTRWDLWNKTLEICKKYNIKTLLDIGCANGHFPFLCLSNNIVAYGVDPRNYDWADHLIEKKFGGKYLYQGTFNSITNHFNVKDKNIKFDCITILNFLHGKGHVKEEIIELFSFISNHAKYFLCTQPNWKDLAIEDLLSQFEVVEKIETHFTLTELIYEIIKTKNIKKIKYLYQKSKTHYLYKI
jgi:hypothetical protein